jgi:hypothetical protein
MSGKCDAAEASADELATQKKGVTVTDQFLPIPADGALAAPSSGHRTQLQQAQKIQRKVSAGDTLC